VLMVTAVYWVSEAVPLGAAALVPAFLYPLFGVLKSSEVGLHVSSAVCLLLVYSFSANIFTMENGKKAPFELVRTKGVKTRKQRSDSAIYIYIYIYMYMYIYKLPFKSLGSPRQFRVFHEKSHFYLSNEYKINSRH